MRRRPDHYRLFGRLLWWLTDASRFIRDRPDSLAALVLGDRVARVRRWLM